MGKTRGSIRELQRSQNHTEKEMYDLKKRMKKIEEDQEVLLRNTIINYLHEKNSPFSPKYRYTYEEIGGFTNRSAAFVSGIAKEEGLSRRNIKVVKN